MRAQMGAAPIQVQPLAENLTLLSGPGGNVVVLNGPDGKIVRYLVRPVIEAAFPFFCPNRASEILSHKKIDAAMSTHDGSAISRECARTERAWRNRSRRKLPILGSLASMEYRDRPRDTSSPSTLPTALW
jgi:hypothetical protein